MYDFDLDDFIRDVCTAIQSRTDGGLNVSAKFESNGISGIVQFSTDSIYLDPTTGKTVRFVCKLSNGKTEKTVRGNGLRRIRKTIETAANRLLNSEDYSLDFAGFNFVGEKGFNAKSFVSCSYHMGHSALF